MKIIKFLLLSVILSSFVLAQEIKYSKFIDSQIGTILTMNENNITKEEIQSILDAQEIVYEKAVDTLMSNKDDFLNNMRYFEKEVFALKKIIAINERAGNNYAVLRDEVAVKSFLVVRNQNRMLKAVLEALNSTTLEEFNEILNNSVAENQAQLLKIFEKDYHEYLAIDKDSSILTKAQKNIREFYALADVNRAYIAHLYDYSNKMYRLNKYAKYHLVNLAIYVNNLEIVKLANPILEPFGLNVIKISVIVFLIVLIYLFRTIAFVWIESYILRIESLHNYSSEIIENIRKIVETLVIIININMVIYVYNDFSTLEMVNKAFNMIYGFLFTLLIFKIVNSIATVRLSSIENINTNVKSELINVGIKILNFIIFIIGLLIILFFAGVNLTAVLSGLGIGGFAVAFAAKDTISNFFGTLSVLFSDVFSQGDWIEINGMEGVVVEIGLRVTTIRTFDNALIAIPNGTFAAKEIKNWNKRVLGRRIKMSIGVKYDSSREDIKNAVSEIRDMLDKHEGIATTNTKFDLDYEHSARLVSKHDQKGVKNTLLVYLDEFGPSSINILVYCFSKSVNWQEWLEVKEDVMHQIMEILEKNNLEFAFPSLSIYNENKE